MCLREAIGAPPMLRFRLKARARGNMYEEGGFSGLGGGHVGDTNGFTVS